MERPIQTPIYQEKFELLVVPREGEEGFLQDVRLSE